MSQEPIPSASKGWFILIDFILLGTAAGVAWTANGELSMIRAACIVLLGVLAFLAFLYPFTLDFFATLSHSRNQMKDAVHEQFMQLDRHFREVVKHYREISDLNDNLGKSVTRAEALVKASESTEGNEQKECQQIVKSVVGEISALLDQKLLQLNEKHREEIKLLATEITGLQGMVAVMKKELPRRDDDLGDILKSIHRQLEQLKTVGVPDFLEMSDEESANLETDSPEVIDDPTPPQSPDSAKEPECVDSEKVPECVDHGTGSEDSEVTRENSGALSEKPPETPVSSHRNKSKADSDKVDEKPLKDNGQVEESDDSGSQSLDKTDNMSEGAVEPDEEFSAGKEENKTKKPPRKKKARTARRKKQQEDKGQHGLWADFADQSVQSDDIYQDDDDRPILGSGRHTRKSADNPDGIVLVAEVIIGIGNTPHVRGEGGGLGWDEGVPMRFAEIGKWEWKVDKMEDDEVVCQIFKNDEIAAFGEDLVIKKGEQVDYFPKFPE